MKNFILFLAAMVVAGIIWGGLFAVIYWVFSGLTGVRF